MSVAELRPRFGADVALLDNTTKTIHRPNDV